ncbi:hypothetical protein B0J13DRAFT_285273 [Dactylonectria estremocensis]|uniref:Uncharacterized protein n=1 Tax=Dactylonectria estremocensis TaxID=1079267 RepID=A0A9P9F1R3_9HYPO|nr:hypothetical protein B0J13DRAFT_285273 [Dactylonectria estremocensis]
MESSSSTSDDSVSLVRYDDRPAPCKLPNKPASSLAEKEFSPLFKEEIKEEPSTQDVSESESESESEYDIATLVRRERSPDTLDKKTFPLFKSFYNEEDLGQDASESEEDKVKVKLELQSNIDWSPPVSYSGSNDGSDDSDKIKSSPPPSHQPLALIHRFNSPCGSGDGPRHRADSHCDLSDELGDDEDMPMPAFRPLSSSGSISLVGLKSILKAPKTWPRHSVRDISNSATGISHIGDHAVSSPSERIQHTKKQAMSIRASASKKKATKKKFNNALKRLALTVLTGSATKKQPWSPRLSKTTRSPRRKQNSHGNQSPIESKGCGDKKNSQTTPKPALHLISSDTQDETDDDDSSIVTPSKIKIKSELGASGPLKQKKSLRLVISSDTPDEMDDEDSRINMPSKIRIKAEPGARDLLKQTRRTEADTIQSSRRPRERREQTPVENSVFDVRSFKPIIIRDGVAEHAIKPTIARLEQKIAAGGVLNNRGQSSASKYKWDIDWSLPVALSAATSRAMEAELWHRGIRTDSQYGNFWYNLTMKYSHLAGSSVPLFTMKKQSLDDFVKESMENRRDLAPESKNGVKKPPKKLEGVEALKLWGAGETDDEDSSSGSDNQEDLVAKMHEVTKNRRLRSGVGTSLGR